MSSTGKAAGPRIVMMGGGALGGYVGAHLAQAGHDVTILDFWHDNIEAIRRSGLQLSGLTPEETFSAPVETMHPHEVSNLARQAPIDIAFVSMKSYDTDWITTMIKPYLSTAGYVVSLQNCINEETIAGIVGWGKTIGCIASAISVELYEPGRIRRQAPKATGDTTIFRVGEVHGRITQRLEELAAMMRHVDGTKATTNLWGERWSKLSQNAMRNGLSAATGLSGREMDEIEPIRHFSMKLAGEAVRIGYALGYELEKVGKLDPQELLKAHNGDRDAFARVDAVMLAQTTSGARGALQRPSMGQDMIKGRRTEIDYINGFIVKKGAEIGIDAPANALLTEAVKRVERGDAPARIENVLPG